jgi:DNA polymerase I-like protein with 3'-5' exonuclease and polymerase domains
LIVRSLSGLEDLIKLVYNQSILAFDIETTGLSHRKHTITDIAIACESFAANVVMQEFTNGCLVNVLTMEQVRPLIELLCTKKLIMHNASFDCKFIISHFNIPINKALYADTVTLQHLLDENLFNYGLKELGAKYFGSSVLNEKEDMLASIKANGGLEKEFYKADSNIRALYAIQDVKLTYKLFLKLDPQLDEQGLRNFYYEDETMPLLKNVLINAEMKGVPVDVLALEEAKKQIEVDIKNLKTSIHEQIEPLLDGFKTWLINYKYPFKLSGPFLQKLASKIAPPNWPLSDSGNYSFSKVEIKKAIKKGLIPENTLLERYSTGLDRIPNELQLELQWELVKEDSEDYLFNIESLDHLKRLFFTSNTCTSALNETPLSTTAKGAPQVDDEFLELMAKKYTWAKDLQTFRSLRKIESTYIERFLNEQENGVFYPRFMQHRAVTGRLSGDTQQLPRPLEEGQAPEVVRKYNNKIRTFFISGPDHTFADIDYESQEIFVFAHVSGEQRIKDIFHRGDDFYSTVCIETEGLKDYSANKKAPNYLGKQAKHKRQTAKAYALGLAFNMSPYKLKFELNCSEEAAKVLYDNYFRAYPDLKKWLDDSKLFALKNGYIKTQAGRVRRFEGLKENYAKYGPVLFDGLALWKAYNESPGFYEHMKRVSGICKNHLNAAANFQIQSLAASITSRAAVKTALEYEKENMKSYICNLVHDEIIVLAPDNELEKALNILQKCMETAYPLSVPLAAPQSSGKNWLESK